MGYRRVLLSPVRACPSVALVLVSLLWDSVSSTVVELGGPFVCISCSITGVVSNLNPFSANTSWNSVSKASSSFFFRRQVVRDGG